MPTVAIAIGVFWKKRMKRTSAARCGSLPSSFARFRTSIARGAGSAVGTERDLVEQTHRNRFAASGLEIEVQNFRLHFAGGRAERCQERGAFACDDVAKLE